ncbi:MAG: sodium:proline symporter, partial [Gemmatimonadota bacterium]
MLRVLKYTLFSGTAVGSGSGDWYLILGMLAVVGIYSTLSGLWGVVATDFVQFIMAMVGFIILAVVAVQHVGGVAALQTQVAANFSGGAQAFRFLPDFSAANRWMPLNIFLIMLFIQWWATWYPGAEPGGGGYIVQRMASCKDERHSLLATLWFQIAHYCVRPWPWLMIAFVALAMYPDLRSMADPGVGFPMVIRDLAPAGVRGLVLVAFFAAFMSTISTQMNWGASYLVSDFYHRFIRPDASDRHLARMSRLVSVFVLALGAGAAWLMRDMSVDHAWKFLAALGAGTGAVFMLRWYWWRINAWTEIAAMVASLVFFVIVSRFVVQNEHRMAVVAALTIGTWLLVTFLTRPERPETLERFYRKVRPGGPGWRPQAAACPDVEPDRNVGVSILAALFAAGIVYLTLPGVGLIIFGQYGKATVALSGAVLCGVAVFALMRRIGWETIAR